MDWTIFKLISWTEGYFKEQGVDSPRLTAEILLGFCLDIKRLDLYLQHDRPLEASELAKFKALIKRRCQGEPVAYITGEKGFFESEFQVAPGVLIPRPDTEVLLETAMAFLGKKDSRANVLEMGVGSGALIVSLAQACPDHSYFGSDISPMALETARKNARRLLETPIEFFQGSWLEALSPDVDFDLILSNPPYIPSHDIEDLARDIREYEPRLALDGGEDGLDCYRLILESAASHLAPGGILAMEMGYDQKPGMSALVDSRSGFLPPRFIRDLAGHHRVVVLEKRN